PVGGKAWLGLPVPRHQRRDYASAGRAAPGAAPGQTAERAWWTSRAADGLGFSEEPGLGHRPGGLAAWPAGTLGAGRQSRSGRTVGRTVRGPDARRGVVS